LRGLTLGLGVETETHQGHGKEAGGKKNDFFHGL
jgi:hypothetical protein